MSKRQRQMKEKIKNQRKKDTVASSTNVSSALQHSSIKKKTALKGENFYIDKAKLTRRKLLKSGKAQRNASGEIVKAAEFANTKTDKPVVRVEPNRKWFGNTRTLSTEHLEKFKKEMTTKLANPYQILLKQNKLPMSLMEESKNFTNSHLLEVESFESTFGKNASRHRPKLPVDSLEALTLKAQSLQDIFRDKQTEAEAVEASTDILARDAAGDVQQEKCFKKGQSKRIWNELYKVSSISCAAKLYM